MYVLLAPCETENEAFNYYIQHSNDRVKIVECKFIDHLEAGVKVNFSKMTLLSWTSQINGTFEKPQFVRTIINVGSPHWAFDSPDEFVRVFSWAPQLPSSDEVKNWDSINNFWEIYYYANIVNRTVVADWAVYQTITVDEFLKHHSMFDKYGFGMPSEVYLLESPQPQPTVIETTEQTRLALSAVLGLAGVACLAMGLTKKKPV